MQEVVRECTRKPVAGVAITLLDIIMVAHLHLHVDHCPTFVVLIAIRQKQNLLSISLH